MATGEDFLSSQKLDLVRAHEPAATIDQFVQVSPMKWMLHATCNATLGLFLSVLPVYPRHC